MPINTSNTFWEFLKINNNKNLSFLNHSDLDIPKKEYTTYVYSMNIDELGVIPIK